MVATFAIGMLSSRLAVKGGLARMSLQGVAASWGNVAYLGVPLCRAAFGDAAALPTGANAFVLAKQFDTSVEQNTASVLLSTAFSVVTVSALLVWLRVS